MILVNLRKIVEFRNQDKCKNHPDLKVTEHSKTENSTEAVKFLDA